MRLNGWQRLYSLLVVAWLGYWAYAAYTDNQLIDNRLVELQEAIERYQQKASAPAKPENASSLIHHFQGGSPEQRLALYQEQLAEVQHHKSTNNIFLSLVATLPPLVIYLLVAWIAAGFRQRTG